MPVSKAELTNAYRLILGREPETQITESDLERWSNWQDMRLSFLHSPEAKFKLSDLAFDGFESGSAKEGLRSEWIRTTTYFGSTIYVRLLDTFSRRILMTGRCNDGMTSAILRRLKPNSVFLDLGANIGWFTLLAAHFIASRKGTGHVYAVEANPNVLPYLFASVVDSNLSPYVSIRPYAVSDCLSTVEMDARTIGNLGGYGISGPEQKLAERNVLPAIPLDALFPDLEQLDLVKIDIEGSEYLAIEGGIRLLSRLKPTIIMEINVRRLKGVSKRGAQDVLDLMRSMGFQPYAFEGREKGEERLLSDAEVHELLRDNNNLLDFMFLPG